MKKQVFLGLPVRRAREAPRDMISARVSLWMAEMDARPVEALQPTGKPFREYMEKHLAEAHGDNQPKTLEGYRQFLGLLGETLGWPDVRDITRESFRAALPVLKRGIEPKTWANRIGEFGHFARWLMDEDHTASDFTRGVKRPARSEFGTHEEIFKEEWYSPLWDELAIWGRPIWEDFWYTGMDNKDLWEFQPRRHMLQTDKGWKIWKTRSKEKTQIDQPISSKLLPRWLARYAECGPDGFLHPEGQAYADWDSWGGQFRKELTRAQMRIGLPRLSPKVTRHTFVTRHLRRLIRGEKNAPTIDEMRRWLGHSYASREVERVYWKLKSDPSKMD